MWEHKVGAGNDCRSKMVTIGLRPAIIYDTGGRTTIELCDWYLARPQGNLLRAKELQKRDLLSPTVPPATLKKALPANPSINRETSSVPTFFATAQGISHIRKKPKEII